VNGQTFVLHNPVQDGAVEADKQNPYILDHNPCGSSAGSAVAVAANLCVVAVGTETDGSVVCPSAVSGIVGIKPTIGLVSRSGIIPISHTKIRLDQWQEQLKMLLFYLEYWQELILKIQLPMKVKESANRLY
jgi:hypothetical protein